MSVIYTDLDLSFRKHPVSRDVLKKTDVDAVKQSLKNIFLTDPMSLAFNPNLGIGIKGFLFENMAAPLQGALKRKIVEQIARFEPRCIIEDLTIANINENDLNISISFYVWGIPTQQSFNFVLERTR